MGPTGQIRWNSCGVPWKAAQHLTFEKLKTSKATAVAADSERQEAKTARDRSGHWAQGALQTQGRQANRQPHAPMPQARTTPGETYCFFSCLWPLLFGLPLSDPLLAFRVWGGKKIRDFSSQFSGPHKPQFHNVLNATLLNTSFQTERHLSLCLVVFTLSFWKLICLLLLSYL